MEHGYHRHRRRKPDPAVARNVVSALAWPAVLGLHLLLRIQGEQWRVQADGASAVRQTHLRRYDPPAPGCRATRRKSLDEPGVFRLLSGVDDDQPAIRPAIWRAPARARGAD